MYWITTRLEKSISSKFQIRPTLLPLFHESSVILESLSRWSIYRWRRESRLTSSPRNLGLTEPPRSDGLRSLEPVEFTSVLPTTRQRSFPTERFLSNIFRCPVRIIATASFSWKHNFCILNRDSGIRTPIFWDSNGTDATLVGPSGENVVIEETDDPNSIRTWRAASVNECRLCHNAGIGVVAGFKHQQLNRLVGPPTEYISQIERLMASHVLTSKAEKQTVASPC